ncbi:hypothetical protein NBRC116188_08280 [Oceaniserpentilla sp. 4NH20-0058]|uniref:hybrid sensor histidine kinase/response regulator n=1 Tax=Oceaniserpentilla sp. 4NH20-0058 TaxID=3127660 RepID=UPI00310BEE97
MKFKTLHSQVNIALIILAITLLTQLFAARTSLSVLSDNQNLLIRTYDNISIIYELERDVIDLQRNLLIYKETASDSSIHRFTTVVQSIQEKIIILSESMVKGGEYQIDKDMFDRMVKHIQDYEENFSSVIHARSQQQQSIININDELNFVFDQFNAKEKDYKNNVGIRTLFIDVRQSVNSYLKSLDPKDSALFYEKTGELISKLTSDDMNPIVTALKGIKADFQRLIQLNRGYLYLVNVVMAGSANEFLFLTKKIREQANSYQSDIDSKAKISSVKIQKQHAIVSIISILIILVIAVYLSKRLLYPIKTLTYVFNRLSKGEEIEGIPDVQRQDEIGDLARAAEVFHNNNNLTKDLLVQSQDMIANQEVLNIQLEQEKERAESATKSKSMFLANMSHEIRTPMNGIVGLVDLMKKTDLKLQQKDYLDRIAYSGQIMMNVINDILDFSKIEAGKMEIEHIEFDINNIIENIISSMQVRVKEKNLIFKVWVSGKVPKKLEGDPLRISQILLNLCSNSIKFTDLGGLHVRFDYEDNKLLFSVSDTGIGMNQDQLDTIFESFTQADGSISRKYGGTGLGLTIVDQLIRLMNGKIDVHSKVNEGTQIHVSITCPISGNETALLPLECENICYIPKYEVEEWLLNFNEKQTHKLKIISDEKIKNVICEDDIHQYILFEGLNALNETCITSALYHHKILGCILESNENSQQSILKAFSGIKILEHPFSPRQFQQFLETILDNQTKQEQEVSKEDEQDKLSGHILLVEDNQINQLVAGDMLETLGLTFDIAENGEEAIEKVAVNNYDLVLMDVQMPKMDGYTATQKLRELGYDDLVICGLSANALKEDLKNAKESGMTDYLTKPLIIDNLYKTLSLYLS